MLKSLSNLAHIKEKKNNNYRATNLCNPQTGELHTFVSLKIIRKYIKYKRLENTDPSQIGGHNGE